MVLFAGSLKQGTKAVVPGQLRYLNTLDDGGFGTLSGKTGHDRLGTDVPKPGRIPVRMPPWHRWGWPEAFLAQQLKLGPDYDSPPISGRYRPMQGGWVANPVFNQVDLDD